MITSIIHETSTYSKSGSSTLTSLVELRVEDSLKTTTKLFRFVYKNGNSYEDFNGECFNKKSGKWNRIFNIDELGFKRDGSSYLILTETELKKRVMEMVNKGREYIKLLYS